MLILTTATLWVLGRKHEIAYLRRNGFIKEGGWVIAVGLIRDYWNTLTDPAHVMVELTIEILSAIPDSCTHGFGSSDTIGKSMGSKHGTNEPLNLERVQALVEEGYISKRKHPDLPLWIYNYTAKTAYDRKWTPETLACRGLILDSEGEVIARPFPKFFNIEEHSRSDILFSRPAQVFEKLDGSLGIYWHYMDREGIATRGSFESDQAKWATRWIAEKDIKLSSWMPDAEYTYLFEILFPDNRIVVDYGERAELVFLTAIHTETGTNVFTFGDDRDWPGTHAKVYDLADIHPRDLATLEEPNSEGFVVFFPHANTRMKVKFEEYKRLHRILTGTNTKSVWAALANGDNLDELLERVPDEFYEWVKRYVADLNGRFDTIWYKAHTEYKEVLIKIRESEPDGAGSLDLIREQIVKTPRLRGEFARLAKKASHPGLMFALLDNKRPSEQVWKLLKPEKAQWFFNGDPEDV